MANPGAGKSSRKPNQEQSPPPESQTTSDRWRHATIFLGALSRSSRNDRSRPDRWVLVLAQPQRRDQPQSEANFSALRRRSPLREPPPSRHKLPPSDVPRAPRSRRHSTAR